MKNALRIGLIHLAVAHKRFENNFNDLMKLIDQAINHGAQIVVTPELALSGYSFRSRSDILPYTESANGPVISKLSQVARGSSVYICIGVAERDDKTGIIYNSAFVINPNGEVVCRYRKISAESRWACSGSPYQDNVFETPWGRVGVLICADSYYGLIPRCTVLRGADLIIVLANWPPSGMDPRELWRARAIENGIFVVACNRSGIDLIMDCCEAPSCAYDPVGRSIFEGISKDSTVFLVDLPLSGNGRLENGYREDRLKTRSLDLYRECALNLWPVRDLTSFLGLPACGMLSTVCVVPAENEHPVEALNRLMKHQAIQKGALCILPAFESSDVILEALRSVTKVSQIGILWRDGYISGNGYIMIKDGDVVRYDEFLTGGSGERALPEFDFGPARIAIAPFKVLEHPEVAVALAKKGCDIAVSSEWFLEGEWRIIGGVRTVENIAVAICGSNGAGIWIPPHGHERWGEVIAGRGEYCLFNVDTSHTRCKRFQDRVDFELLLRGEKQ
ncbi:MAG: nitrilase-related carbon-nitrogen hydrolase [Thermodesulforhabdaceae bacterium]